MQDYAVNNSETSNFELVRLSMGSLTKIYDQIVDKTDLDGEAGEFLRFYDNWGKSIIYKIPSGYIRFEPYPRLEASTVHGIFFGNPFRDSENIKNLLDFYLDKHPEMTHIECHVDKKFRGVLKLVGSMATSSTYRDEKWIFSYGGK